MSVFYTIKEHLHLDNIVNHNEAVGILHTKLSLLGAAMLRSTAYVDKAVIVADGEEITFKGRMVNHVFHKVMNEVAGAQRTLDVTLSYSFMRYAWSEAIDPGPFEMMDYLAKENPQELDGLFYSMYNHADCAEDGHGIIAAYGKSGDTFYNGIVPSQKVAALPDGGWYAPITAVIYDPDEEDAVGVDMDAVEEVCRQLCEFSSDDTLERDENGLAFYLNNLVLRNDAELQAFAALCGKLMTLTNNQCGIMAELSDLDSMDPRTATVKIFADGSYTVELVTV